MLEKIYKWFDTYWYHYKWHTIIVLFFAVTITICVSQCSERTQPDIVVMYAGPRQLNANEHREIELAFNTVMPSDYNDDGQKHAELNPLVLMTDKQLAEAKERIEAEGGKFYYDANTLNNNKNSFSNQMFAGESSICLLDPNWFDTVNKAGGFRKLADVLGYLPEKAINDYSIRLKDTAFAQYFNAFDTLPDDTIICFRVFTSASSLMPGRTNEEKYEHQLDMFKQIMNFELPEGAEISK